MAHRQMYFASAAQEIILDKICNTINVHKVAFKINHLEPRNRYKWKATLALLLFQDPSITSLNITWVNIFLFYELNISNILFTK
jgi:hypothetical protein